MNKPLRFNIELGRTKPVNIRNEQVRCPFCDRSKLTDILDTSGHIIWLMNKYPVLEKTWPTVIIETETDEGEFSTLPTARTGASGLKRILYSKNPIIGWVDKVMRTS